MAFNWDQYQQTPEDQMGSLGVGVQFDPSQASPTTGIGGGGGVSSVPAMPPAVIGPGQPGQMQTAGDPQQFFNQLFPGETLTPEMLTQNEAALKAQGITLVRNAAGIPGKIKLPNGQVVDVIQGAGSGLNRKQWLTGDGGGAGMGTLNQFGQGMGFMTAPFVPPTAAEAMASPGTQYALDEAMRAMQNSAAAKGTLLNGRTLQAELNAISNNAAGQYGDVYNRAFQTFTRNQDAPFQKYTTLADLGQRSAAQS